MNYTLEHSLVQGCLRIQISGTWPFGKAEKAMTDMFNIWEKHKKPMLIDMRNVADTPSVLRDYEEAEQFARVGFNRVGRIAVLDIPERREANSFFVTTSFNRGIRFMFFYSDEKEAIDWLLSEEEG